MESRDKDRLGDWLDGALQKYGDVEPRAGLERRVLANLARAAQQPAPWQIWKLGFSGAVALAAIAGLVWVGSSKQQRSRNIQSQPIASTTNQRSAVMDLAETSRRTVRVVHKKSSPKHGSQLAKLPRPSQFPSPRPLSEQEELLVAYVTEFPEQAAEVAQEQAKWERELEAMYSILKTDSESNEER